MARNRSSNASRKEMDGHWTELLEGVRQVQAREPMTSKRFFDLYTKVYDYCIRATDSQTTPSLSGTRVSNRLQKGNLKANPPVFAGQELYHKLEEFLLADLQAFTKQCSEKSGESLLVMYSKEWDQYVFTGKVINAIFSYLNRHFVRRESEGGKAIVFQIYQLALDTWKETVLEKTHHNLTIGVLNLLERERHGETINGTLVQTIVASLVDLGLNDAGERIVTNNLQDNLAHQMDPATGLRVALGTYQKFFECHYLQNIREFYKKESHAFLHDQGNSVVDYMKKVEQRLLEEDARAERYLHMSTKMKQRYECVETLIRVNLDAIYAEFCKLLSQEKNEDTSRCYILVSKLDNALPHMANLFRNHVASQGHQKLEALGTSISEPKPFVNTVLEVYRKFKTLVELSFNTDPVFNAALNKACGDFINNNCLTKSAKSKMKSAELLARYCDIFLRKSYKTSEDDDVEDGQNDVMVVFKFLEDKDVFQKFYSKMFANRLVYQLSASDDAESAMIAKLKHACGFEYTAKLQRMYQDICVTRELQDEFRTFLDDNFDNVQSDFQVHILSTSAWPFTPCSSEFALPSELEPNIQAFQTFYLSKYTGRKLTWLFSKSRGELTSNCFEGKYIFQSSAYQMAVLLMFNSADSLRFQEIQDATKLQSELLSQILQTIIKAKLCICADDEEELNPDSIIKLHSGYKSKKFRVNINIPLKSEAKKESDHTETAVEEDRKILLQACIVRIMKMRKTVQHQTLLVEVMQQMTRHFRTDVPSIKKCIDMLIEKEYMERVADEKDTYAYVA